MSDNEDDAMDIDNNDQHQPQPTRKKQRLVNGSSSTSNNNNTTQEDDDNDSVADDLLRDILQDRARVDNDEEDDEEDVNNGSSSASAAAAAARRLGGHILGDIDVQGRGVQEEEDGEDLLENAERDYEEHEELDQYDDADLDGNEYGPMSLDARRAAEAIMRERDMSTTRVGGARVPRLLGVGDDDEMDESDDEEAQLRRERLEEGLDEDVEPMPISLQNLNLPFAEMMQRPEVIAQIKREFYEFLREYMREPTASTGANQSTGNANVPAYVSAIRVMCARNQQSMTVSYEDLMKGASILASFLASGPKAMVELFGPVATSLTFELLPAYRNIHQDIFVRITNFPFKDTLRDLRTTHINGLVRVPGVVTRRSSVMPTPWRVYYECLKCKSVEGPYELAPHTQRLPDPPRHCGPCGDVNARYRVNNEKTQYKNFQKITLQESPGSVPAGRIPRYKEVILTDDLIDQARPGELVEITGILTNSYDRALNTKQGFPVFNTVIEANHVERFDDSRTLLQITDEDKKEFNKLKKDPRIVKRIIASIAPSIYGHEHVKTALALAMFSGQEKNIENKHRVRGDINVLLLGDPGTAKSQCLKYVEKMAPRAVFTTGKGASAVGLTAAVHKDPMTREWTLEGGALVLADRGVCLIDEFDKMNDQDRTSIHEAMEQQSISISKAGIVTQLKARCSVIAAANPINGRYDPQRSFADNVELTDPILQRFDILCVLQDTVDPVVDESLARFVVSSHVRSHPDANKEVVDEESMAVTESQQEGQDELSQQQPSEIKMKPSLAALNQNVYNDTFIQGSVEPIPQNLFRKLIMYARTLRPRFQNVDKNKLSKFYQDLRQQSIRAGGVPIAVRHLESIIRMAESFARMHLREYVRDDDVDAAIRVLAESFIRAQKFSIMKSLTASFRRYLPSKRDEFDILRHLLSKVVEEHRNYALVMNKGRKSLVTQVEIPKEELEDKAREQKIFDLSSFYDHLSSLQSGKYVIKDRSLIKLLR